MEMEADRGEEREVECVKEQGEGESDRGEGGGQGRKRTGETGERREEKRLRQEKGDRARPHND